MKMSSSIKNDGEIKKFLFDNNDFDTANAPAAPPPPMFSEDQLGLAKNEAYAKGRQDGIRETRAAQEEQTQKSMMQIAAALEKLLAGEDRREIATMVQTVKLSMKVTHKLLPQFAQRFALEEIERVILDSIEARRDEPRIAITVSGRHLDTLRHHIESLALEKGYAGKIILIADDNLTAADVRVEWADGGAERLYERLYSQVESEFAKAIAGMQSTLKTGKE